MTNLKECLKTGAKIGSSIWNRQPVCNCKNCIEYFEYLKLNGPNHIEKTNDKP
jgi:hypothetical protein